MEPKRNTITIIHTGNTNKQKIKRNNILNDIDDNENIKRGSRNKENNQNNSFKIKSKTVNLVKNTRRTTKFALINIINSTRGTVVKERSLEDRLKFYSVFSDKENILQLFKNKHNNNFENRYLEFRQYEHPLDKQFTNLEDKGVYYKIICSGAKIIEQILNDNELYPTKSNSKPSIFWSNSLISHEFFSSLDCYQKVNHFPKTSEISRKDFMFINVAKMRQKFPRDYNFVPNSFILPKDNGMLVKEMDFNAGKKTYICKPVASSQGKGIFVTNDINEVI